MPNIIEQQDLLKGLPDNRLAMLLQNPVADIPPFLVAAEAQRRQAIRQQFAGSTPKESVVDSLTKQLVNVPQNIQAPAQTPSNVPPTPQMQGVMALQQQQAMQQAAQEAQPQQMRAGGPVRRFAGEGYVRPTVSGLASDITGKSKEQYIREQELLRAPPGSRARYLLKNPVVPKTESQLAEEEFKAATEGPFSGFYSPESVYETAQNLNKKNREEQAKMPPGASAGMSFTPKIPEPGKEATSEENKDKGTVKPLAGETPDEYRARLEELLKTQEPSSWEKAQRWFAMAEQFFDPSKTTGQSIASAGRAFAEMTGEQSRAQREAELASKRALLEYDINERDRVRAAEAERAKREYESALKIQERQTLSAGDAIDGLNSTLKVLNDQIKSIDEDFTLDAEAKATAKASIVKQIENVQIQMAKIMSQSGYSTSGVLTMDQLRQMAAGKQ